MWASVMPTHRGHHRCCAQVEYLDENFAVAREPYLRVQLTHICLTLCNAPRAHAVISAAMQARQRSHKCATACGINHSQLRKVTSSSSSGT